MAIAIKAENLSKAYQLGDFGTGTISRDLERFWARVRGKEDPFLKIGETNDRSVKGESDVVWSLQDLNFEIEQGEALGVIGRNGAGKSTLLKILSRVTSPTTGSVKIKGRIASLLEVGTGFHPELTGRENIYLNGAILGMRKAEIKRKFDEIVDFAEVARYIDTPVKRYSSGMYVRLAFAVAAHLESEILVVDEVLAVGDAEFQKKCLGKMGDVSKGEGRTILFVSHNMGSILNLCNKGMLLNHGRLHSTGQISNVLTDYNNLLNTGSNIDGVFNGNLTGKIEFESISINGQKHSNVLAADKAIDITVGGNAKTNFDRVIFIVSLYCNGVRLFTLRESADGKALANGDFNISFNLSPGALRPGNYTLALGAWGDHDDDWIWGTDMYMLTIAETWTQSIRKTDEGIFNGEFLRNDGRTL
jgi:homopolymeric O-antigen transport system ATP-binding protein